MKVKNTPTHHRGEYNVSGTTQASFLAKFKATPNKLGQKRHRHSVPHTHTTHTHTHTHTHAFDMELKNTAKNEHPIYQQIPLHIHD